jgi:hypothetical protein
MRLPAPTARCLERPSSAPGRAGGESLSAQRDGTPVRGGHRLRAEHGLSAAATGRLVASADRVPPWTTLRCAVPTSPNGPTVIL